MNTPPRKYIKSIGEPIIIAASPNWWYSYVVFPQPDRGVSHVQTANMPGDK